MAAMGVKADPVNWSDGNENSIKYDIHDNEVVIEVGNEGALAAFFAATDNEAVAGQQAISGATSTKLKIKSMGGPDASAVTLSAFDIAALNVLSTYTEVDLSEVSVGLANMNGLSMSNLQYLVLPEGNSGVDLWNTIGKSEFKNQNPNLKMAASVTNATDTDLPTWNGNGDNRTATKTGEINTKKLALYSYVENSVDGFKGKYNNLFDNIDKLDMAGAYGNQDLVKNNNKVFNSNKLHYFDFTGASFAQMENEQSYTTVDNPAYDSEFSNGQMSNGSNKTETTTNSFNYFKNYVSSAYTVSLPTGNTDVPAGLFTAQNLNTIGLLEVTIPEGYTRIGAEAFRGAPITSLHLPASMQFVSYGAFRRCNALVDVEMEASNTSCTFEDKAFMFCTNLKHFTMGEGVTCIPDLMFEQCANLEYIRIPSTCTYIGNRAFYLNMSLHSVTIPVGVQRIDHCAFILSGLTDIYLLATQPQDLPLIYAVTNFNYDANSSFTRKDIIGENTPALANAGTAETRIRQSHSDVVPNYYQEALSNGGYLGSGRCLVNLHYPDALSTFINAISYDDGTYSTPDLSSYSRLNGLTSISDAYQYTDADGNKWPRQDRPNGATDYQIRFAAGNVNGQTIYGWRQFALSSGGVENYSRLYDETWYTICFPWNTSDTQLFEAFNQKCEIVEFKGVEVIADEEEDNTYHMVLHFDEVATTHYMDRDNNEYNRYLDGEYSVTEGGITVTYKKHRYVQLDEDGNETSKEVTYTENADMGSDVNVLYFQIENIIAIAGHPYMIHPAAVEHQGRASLCTIGGVRRVAKTDAELQAFEEAGKVTRSATTGDATTTFTSPLGGGGTYTFHGYLGRGVYDNDGKAIPSYNQDNDKSNIPQYSYFLAAPEGTKYPKYYREMANPATGKWMLYTAIITPDEDAINNIEALNGAKVQNSANVAFGEWEQVEATAIEEIIADAQEKGQEVREVYMNVVYNINGQVVRTNGQIEGLPKGLYIVNGKKYMVK